LRVFEPPFPYIEKVCQPEQADELFSDILRYVFNASGGGQLLIMRLVGADGEIGLRVGETEWFGAVNVGDTKMLCNSYTALRGDNEHYVVEDCHARITVEQRVAPPCAVNGGHIHRIMCGE
jgi:hypothetical protein